jgi:hypothetical protein
MLKIDTYPVGFNIRQIQDEIDHSEKFIKAEAGHPCLIPRKTLKRAETHPLFRIHPFISVYIV